MSCSSADHDILFEGDSPGQAITGSDLLVSQENGQMATKPWYNDKHQSGTEKRLSSGVFILSLSQVDSQGPADVTARSGDKSFKEKQESRLKKQQERSRHLLSSLWGWKPQRWLVGAGAGPGLVPCLPNKHEVLRICQGSLEKQSQ